LAVDVLQGKHILIVEDNEVVRDGLALVLRRTGCEVTGVAESGAALALLRGGFRPTLILLDMLTPGRDGWHFMAEWRGAAALGSVPVIIHTAMGVASQEWAASLGACGLIRKPIDTDLLVEKIRRCLTPGEIAC
jgi:CheY-like chemotaxis protein